jgi:hypothetical protein
MELFKNIRLNIGKAILTKKIAGIKKTKSYSDFSQVKKIGIVWDASSTDDFSILSRFHQKMNERGIEVIIHGYYPGKNLPDKYTAIRYMTCIRKMETNLFYHPVSTETNNFISTRFDILIDINFNKLFPLFYISSLSNAGLKVGLYESETLNTPFSMMMDLKKPINLENYLSHVVHYLEMIKS